MMPPSNPSDDYFIQLADGAPVMIWLSGLDMGCFYFNRAWLDFRGRTLEEEAGNGWAEGVHPEDLECCVSHYIGCFERRLAFAMSYRLKNRAGAYRWILDRGAPHYLPDGTFLGFFGGCADIENDAQLARHAELGTSLAEMRKFALRIATQGVATFKAPNSTTQVPLGIAAKNLHREQEKRMQHAVAEMQQLATDMLSFKSIGQGEFYPELAAKTP